MPWLLWLLVEICEPPRTNNLVERIGYGACSNSVTLGGQRYASAGEGIAAANAACSSILASIDPLETPVVSDLRLARPTNPIIATNGLKTRGVPPIGW